MLFFRSVRFLWLLTYTSVYFFQTSSGGSGVHVLEYVHLVFSADLPDAALNKVYEPICVFRCLVVVAQKLAQRGLYRTQYVFYK